jgi:hypothetical protein
MGARRGVACFGLNYVIDGPGVYHLHSRLNANLIPLRKEGENKDFYAGLDVVSQQIDEVTATAIDEAKTALGENKAEGRRKRRRPSKG